MPRPKPEGVRGMTIAELEAKAQLMDKVAALVKESGLYGRSRRAKPTSPSQDKPEVPQRRRRRTSRAGLVTGPGPAPKDSKADETTQQAAHSREASPSQDPELMEAARNATVTDPEPAPKPAEGQVTRAAREAGVIPSTSEPEAKPARKPPQLARQTLQRAAPNPKPSMPHGTLPSDYDRPAND